MVATHSGFLQTALTIYFEVSVRFRVLVGNVVGDHFIRHIT